MTDINGAFLIMRRRNPSGKYEYLLNHRASEVDSVKMGIFYPAGAFDLGGGGLNQEEKEMEGDSGVKVGLVREVKEELFFNIQGFVDLGLANQIFQLNFGGNKSAYFLLDMDEAQKFAPHDLRNVAFHYSTSPDRDQSGKYKPDEVKRSEWLSTEQIRALPENAMFVNYRFLIELLEGDIEKDALFEKYQYEVQIRPDGISEVTYVGKKEGERLSDFK